ncbi:MAG TPA: sulfotransferase [Steroidobacteraceae bacterium]|nr:sulfotransferase [Steroidobacteraceae bacterium]
MHVDDSAVGGASHTQSSVAPFFIVGSSRSGSTLLRLMLASHSRIAIPSETWYLIDLLEEFPFDRVLQENEIGAAVSLMTNHYTWPDMGLDAAEFRHRAANLSGVRLGDLVEIVYRWHMEVAGKSRWGDKTPAYIEIVPALAAMFGDAKFIHLIRDGRDVAKSFQRQGWHGPWMHGYAREWLRAVELDLKLGRTRLNERILRVRYEDLVLHPEATLRRICAFIDERFEDQMLLWRGKIAAAIPDREKRIHSTLSRDMNPSDVSRWKREMTSREVFVAEALIGTQLSHFGYERRYRSKLWSPLFAATRIYCRSVLPVVDLQRRVSGFVGRRLRKCAKSGSRFT